AEDFGRGHLPGTINIPLDRSFTTWAGWLIPYDRDFHLILEDDCDGCVQEAAHDLAMIGLDRIEGYFSAAEVRNAVAANGLQTVPQMTIAELEAGLDTGSVHVLDV